ncbi:MAG: lipopolysaccharide heptosyltransferase I [Neisseria sp.]|nr:lipopolysaccharide heptosyltransferase I [Neisseria sp.]
MKVLLVRLSSMGDLIHTLPAVSDLSARRPDIELHWLCEAGFADIARLHPFVKKIHTLSWRQWRRQLGKRETWRKIARLKSDLRQEGFDWVLDSQGLIKSALPAKMAGVPVWGLDRDSAREGWAACFYTHTFAVPKGQDAVWRNRNLFAQAFGYELPEKLVFGAKIPEKGRLKTEKPYYVALHAASRDGKLWQPQYWRELMRLIHERDGGTVYLPWGSEMEKERAESLAIGLPYARVCDKMSLMQAAELLQDAAGVAGVDTGLLHLANAFDKPLVGIYTDTDPEKTGVQPSPKAANIGGIGRIPEPQAVFKLLLQGMDAEKPPEQTT